MKRMIFAVFVLLFATTACANGHYHNNGYWRNGYWVAPAVVGGIIGYGIARPYYYPPQVIVQPQPVIVQPPPVYYQQPAPAPQCQLRSEVINGQVVQGNFCY